MPAGWLFWTGGAFLPLTPFSGADVVFLQGPHAPAGHACFLLRFPVESHLRPCAWSSTVDLGQAGFQKVDVHVLSVDEDNRQSAAVSVGAAVFEVNGFVQDEAGEMLGGRLAERLPGVVFFLDVSGASIAKSLKVISVSFATIWMVSPSSTRLHL